MGIEPWVVKSWNLSEKEKESFLSILTTLIENEITLPFSLPFKPREDIKKAKTHKELIFEYLGNLAFISSLPDELKPREIIQEHFDNIRTLIQKYQITQTTLEIPFPFLRLALQEVRNLSSQVGEKLKFIFNIEEEISPEEWERFLKECRYLSSLITLASHYQSIYKEGLPLLGKIVASLIKGKYFELGYNLKDELIKEQLNPLLKHYLPEEHQQILEKWRNPYFTFTIIEREEEIKKIEAPLNRQEILSHLRSQIIEHKHFQALFYLEGFQNLNKSQKNMLLEALHFYLLPKEQREVKKRPNLNEIKNFLEPHISKEKINIILGLIYILQMLNNPEKPVQDILNSLNRLNQNIQQHFPESERVEAWSQDLNGYLRKQLEESLVKREAERRKRKVYLSYFSDHPRTLLEIGKYPVPTCQNFESKGKLNTRLLGYVFDSHLKALVLREVYLKENIDAKILNQSKIELDENNEKITITTPNGTKIEASVSKPIARRIIILGEKNQQSVLLLEPIYPRNFPEELLDLPLRKLEISFQEINLTSVRSGENITIADSHNPSGFYRDI